ncbi:MAG: hypothetical protein ABSF44_00465 [Candidatus Bathyarchaeia archaeon]|jgi:hypothetical protein
MIEARKERSVRSLTGLIIMLLIYAALALTAFSFYPKGFSPLNNTLAQLGDPKLNPSGAIFYNAGVLVVCSMTIFVAIMLLVLPKQWVSSRGAHPRLVLFYLTVSFMLLFSFFYVLTALFPSGADGGLNSLFTLIFLVSLELFIVSSAAGIRRLKDHVHWIPTFGFAAAAIIFLLVLTSAVTGVTIFSWIIGVTSWSYTLAFLYEFS